MISGVKSSDVPRVWPAVVDQIKRVTDRYDAGYDESHVYERLIQAEQQLWIAGTDSIEAVIVSEIQIHPLFKVLAVHIVAGTHIDAWLDELVALMASFGKHHGCKYLESSGRKGWIRKLKSHGLEDHTITIRKAL